MNGLKYVTGERFSNGLLLCACGGSMCIGDHITVTSGLCYKTFLGGNLENQTFHFS